MPQQFYSMTYHDALFLCDYGGFVATGELLQAGQLQADLYDRFQHVLDKMISILDRPSSVILTCASDVTLLFS
jgi:hypothetical protein